MEQMLKITPYKQTDDSRCGPASIKMILSYYGIEASEDELCKRCDWSYELGCTDFQMKRAVESYVFECTILNESNLEQVAYWINRGVPLIVDWFSPGINPELGEMPEGHSSVVVGIDEKYIHLLDPELGGIRSILREEFERVWFDWREHPTLQSCNDLILRQIIVAYPNTIT